ncbi:hypothetical protein [Citrobacter portucalensis]|uniref:hypothetical protein n=1 Tax=Citrobacter portucalensis TaxID=1639133 RepID=UPI00388D99F7
MSITEHSRQFLVKQGQQSAIASFNLYPRNSDDIDADIKTMDNVLSVLSVNHKTPKLRMSWLNGSVMTLKYGSKNTGA